MRPLIPRLESWAHASRVQSDEETYDLERTVVGSVIAGVTADRCGKCGACDRSVDYVAMGDREAGGMEMTERNTEAPKQVVGAPFAWLVQSTSERNPPHGWAVHMFNGQQLRDSIPVYLQSEVDRLYQGVRAYRVLRQAVDAMMARLGYHGTISARDDRVQAVMDALAQIDQEERE